MYGEEPGQAPPRFTALRRDGDDLRVDPRLLRRYVRTHEITASYGKHTELRPPHGPDAVVARGER